MTYGDERERGQGGSDAVLLAAGAADWAVRNVTTALGGLRGLLGRADMAHLAEEGRRDLMARGRLALDRLAASPTPAYTEVLARHAAARHRGGGDA